MSLAQLNILLANRRSCDEYAPRLRWETLEAIASEAKAMADRRCTCEQAEGFEIPVERCTAKTYEAMSNARIDRLREVDAAISGNMGMR